MNVAILLDAQYDRGCDRKGSKDNCLFICTLTAVTVKAAAFGNNWSGRSSRILGRTAQNNSYDSK